MSWFCNPVRTCHCGRNEWAGPAVITAGVSAGLAAVTAEPAVLMVTAVAVVLAAANRAGFLAVGVAAASWMGLALYMWSGSGALMFIGCGTTAAAVGTLWFIVHDFEQRVRHEQARPPVDLHHYTMPARPRQPGLATIVARRAWEGASRVVWRHRVASVARAGARVQQREQQAAAAAAPAPPVWPAPVVEQPGWAAPVAALDPADRAVLEAGTWDVQPAAARPRPRALDTRRTGAARHRRARRPVTRVREETRDAG